MRSIKICTLLLASLIPLAACTDDAKPVEDVVITEPDETQIEDEIQVEEDTGKITFKADIVYFEYDKFTLTDEGMESLNVLAKFLETAPSSKLKIEGHCDIRGSIEYNLALGQRRADAVKTYLESLGVDSLRLTAVSFGEEKPASEGESEEVYSKNRRAEFFLLSH